jgi:CheY-like chemotaxis protein
MPEVHAQGVTILLVEDDDAIRPVLRRVLERHGYSVLLASNGGDALKQAQQRAQSGVVDLVVTDLMMPGMGGVELIGHLTRIYPNIRAVLMSGYSDDVIERAELPPDRVSFLQKPFSLDDLTRRVADVLGAE